LQGITNDMEDACSPVPKPTAELARCFLRLANLPNYALDRLSRYEATLWRQAGQILFALDVLDRRRPWDRRRRFHVAVGKNCRSTTPRHVNFRTCSAADRMEVCGCTLARTANGVSTCQLRGDSAANHSNRNSHTRDGSNHKIRTSSNKTDSRSRNGPSSRSGRRSCRSCNGCGTAAAGIEGSASPPRQ
jgi:hypothetical protein